MVVCIPSGITEVEERAVRDSAEQAGAKEVRLIHEPMAAAIGIGIDVLEPTGNMVIDIGGGTSEIAVIALGGIVCNKSIRVAGDEFNDDIEEYMRKQHNIHIGERTAEDIKKEIGCAQVGETIEEKEVRGIDLMSGLPQTRIITADKTVIAFTECLESLIHGVKAVLEKTPPELAADIYDRGIVLTGGGSMLRGLDKLIVRETGINTYLAENPLDCVAMGTGRALINLDKIPDGLVMMRKVNVR